MNNGKRNRGILRMDRPMTRAACRASFAGAILALLGMAGCGVGQAVKDGTVDAAKWAFTTQVKTMNVDVVGRESLNADAQGRSLSTVVRLYQLKDSKTFDQLDYGRLRAGDLEALRADLLATKDIVLRPGASASVSEPMNDDAQFVGVVAFFREPKPDATWKLAIPKKQWKKTDPVKIEVRGNELVLLGANAQPVRRQAPVQSSPASAGPSSGSPAQGKPAR